MPTVTALLPELALLILGLALMASEVFASGSPARLRSLAGWGLTAILALLFFVPAESVLPFGLFRSDAAARAWKVLFIGAAWLTVLLSGPYLAPRGNARGTVRKAGPFLSLLIFAALGACLLVSAREWMTFFIALELATLPLYALAGFQTRENASAEASAKYLVLGGLATSLVLFGISFLYGASGSLDFASLAVAVQNDAQAPALWLGALFLFAGLGFKLSMAPFHMWAPDVYAGAPTPIMAFLSVGSKSAAAAAMAILLLGPLDPLRCALAPLLGGAAVLSMLVGNLGALRQKNLRRFTAYSAIAQAGYLLLAFLGDREPAQTALLYNLFAYGATSYCFYFVISVIGKSGSEDFDSLRGLSRRNPAVALALLLSMFSLAGVPPFAGFLGKFLLFSAAAERGHYGFVLAGVLNAVISFYYYMLVVKAAYITAEDGPADAPAHALTRAQGWSLAALAAAVLALGVLPQLGRLLQTL